MRQPNRFQFSAAIIFLLRLSTIGCIIRDFSIDEVGQLTFSIILLIFGGIQLIVSSALVYHMRFAVDEVDGSFRTNFWVRSFCRSMLIQNYNMTIVVVLGASPLIHTAMIVLEVVIFHLTVFTYFMIEKKRTSEQMEKFSDREFETVK